LVEMKILPVRFAVRWRLGGVRNRGAEVGFDLLIPGATGRMGRVAAKVYGPKNKAGFTGVCSDMVCGG